MVTFYIKGNMWMHILNSKSPEDLEFLLFEIDTHIAHNENTGTNEGETVCVEVLEEHKSRFFSCLSAWDKYALSVCSFTEWSDDDDGDDDGEPLPEPVAEAEMVDPEQPDNIIKLRAVNQ